MTERAAVGAMLRSLRAKRGLSQRELARRTGCDPSYIVRMEAGSKLPGLLLAQRCDAAMKAEGAFVGRVCAAGNRRRGVAAAAQLPRGSVPIAGRDEVLASVDAGLRRAGGLVVLGGMPGIGKTAVAREWATRHVGRFPDGVLWADLTRCPDTSEVVESFLVGLGVHPADIPRSETARLALFRSVVRDRDVLVVLDGAHCPTQVASLLGGDGDRCRVLVTSRWRLPGILGSYAGEHIHVPRLGTAAAAQVLRQVSGAVVTHSISRRDMATILHACDGVPRALFSVAVTITSSPHLSAWARRLEVEARLELFDRAVPASEESFYAAFASVYRSLSGPAAELFRRCGRAPLGVPLTVPAGSETPHGEPVGSVTADAVRELVCAHLVQETGLRRLTMPRLVQLYAREVDCSPTSRSGCAADGDDQSGLAGHRSS